MYDLENRLRTPSKPHLQSTHPSAHHHQHRHHSHYPQPPLPDSHSVVGDGGHRTGGRGDRRRGCGEAAANTSPQVDQAHQNDFDFGRFSSSHREGGDHDDDGMGDEVAGGRFCVETSTGRRKSSVGSDVATVRWSQEHHREGAGRAEGRGAAANFTGSGSGSSTCSSGDGGDGGDGGSPVVVVKGASNVSRGDGGCASRGAKAGGGASADRNGGKAGKTTRARRSRRRGSAVNPPGIVLI